MTHQAFNPMEVTAQGDSATGDIILFYRDSLGNSVGFRLTPDLLQATLGLLINGCATSNSEKMRAVAQMVSIREVSAQVSHGLATLKYELEAGVELETTIDTDTALRLASVLSTAQAVNLEKH